MPISGENALLALNYSCKIPLYTGENVEWVTLTTKTTLKGRVSLGTGTDP
jgi:hypothetical protein